MKRLAGSFRVKNLIVAIGTRLVLLRESDRGGNLIEYSLLLAFIAVAAIFALTQVGDKTLSNAASVLPGLGG